MQAAGEDGPLTSINVTPLVDILLVVLIIFMATAPLISRRVLKVDVPKADYHERAATDAVQLVFNAKREMILSGKPVSLGQLKAILERAVLANPDLHVTLSAEKTLPYGEIVGLLDAVRACGVRKMGLEVAPKR